MEFETSSAHVRRDARLSQKILSVKFLYLVVNSVFNFRKQLFLKKGV